MPKILENCELINIGTFRSNNFIINKDGEEYECFCVDPEMDWDKLYDHLGLPNLTIEIVKQDADALGVKIY